MNEIGYDSHLTQEEKDWVAKVQSTLNQFKTVVAGKMIVMTIPTYFTFDIDPKLSMESLEFKIMKLNGCENKNCNNKEYETNYEPRSDK